MIMTSVALRVDGAVSGYGGEPVVCGISIQAAAGEVTVIVGPNGSGKSTLMKTITGVVSCSSGRVWLGERDVTGTPTNKLVREGLGYVPQLANVFPSLTIQENLRMGGYSRRAIVPDRIADMFRLFPDLGDARDRPARTLSGGQRNMLAIARALMPNPTVLCVDEPTAGLSPAYENRVWEKLLEVSHTGVAVLAIEQNTRKALSHADRAYILALGELRMQGTGAEMLENDDVVELYVGKARPEPRSD
jgi:branched-chain amino acid transport system ATP-binding protein